MREKNIFEEKTLLNLLKRAWEAWKKIAHKIGAFQSRVLLSVLYVILIIPFSLAVKFFIDPLRLKKKPVDSYWIPRPAQEPSMEEARRQ